MQTSKYDSTYMSNPLRRTIQCKKFSALRIVQCVYPALNYRVFYFVCPGGGGGGDSCAGSHVLDKVGPVHYYHIILRHCLIPHKKICIMLALSLLQLFFFFLIFVFRFKRVGLLLASPRLILSFFDPAVFT